MNLKTTYIIDFSILCRFIRRRTRATPSCSTQSQVTGTVGRTCAKSIEHDKTTWRTTSESRNSPWTVMSSWIPLQMHIRRYWSHGRSKVVQPVSNVRSVSASLDTNPVSQVIGIGQCSRQPYYSSYVVTRCTFTFFRLFLLLEILRDESCPAYNCFQHSTSFFTQ